MVFTWKFAFFCLSGALTRKSGRLRGKTRGKTCKRACQREGNARGYQRVRVTRRMPCTVVWVFSTGGSYSIRENITIQCVELRGQLGLYGMGVLCTRTPPCARCAALCPNLTRDLTSLLTHTRTRARARTHTHREKRRVHGGETLAAYG